MIKYLLNRTPFFVLIAVAGSMLGSVALILYGGAEAVMTIVHFIEAPAIDSKGAKVLALAFIEIIDLFLLGTVFLIISLGLYSLFIDKDLRLPSWLVIQTLDDLKSKLLGVVVVVMAVLFLGQVVSWDGQRDLLGFGVAIGAVIIALTWFLKAGANHSSAE